MTTETKRPPSILLHSGEGEQGRVEAYHDYVGDFSKILRRARANGDRWAKVWYYQYDNEDGQHVYQDTTGELRTFDSWE